MKALREQRLSQKSLFASYPKSGPVSDLLDPNALGRAGWRVAIPPLPPNLLPLTVRNDGSMEADILPRIEQALKRMHPTGKYEEIALDRLDPYTTSRQLKSLLQRVNRSHLPIADIELASSDMERSHILHIGRGSGPSWGEFNRSMSDEERLTSLREHAGSLTYWNIQLSRVGQFWTGYWNEFTVQRGRIMPDIVPAPSDYEWLKIISETRAILTSTGLTEVEQALLDVPVTWMTSAAGYLLDERGRSPSPTVQNCLFNDII
jgi:hypothetical protein